VKTKEDSTVVNEKDEQLFADSGSEVELDQKTFETLRNAALAGKATFPDQIDYYDPEQDEII
jgi:hypothetical protein